MNACAGHRWKGAKGDRCKDSVPEVALGKGIVQELRARATRVYAGSEDAGSLHAGRQVAAECSASVGKEVGCKVDPRLWSKAPGEVFSAADALCKHREVAEWSEAFSEDDCGARSSPWDEQGLWDTPDCRLG